MPSCPDLPASAVRPAYGKAIEPLQPVRRHVLQAMLAAMTLPVVAPSLAAAATRVKAAAVARPAGPVHIVALGDSLSAGYMLGADEAFPAVLERALRAGGYDVTVANAGVSGDTAAGGLQRLDWSVPEGTDAVILELGANDMLRGLEPAQTEATLDAIMTRLQARDIKVLLAGMIAAPNLGPQYVERFDAIYPTLAQRHAVPLYPFFLTGVEQDPGLKLFDGMHPNAAGVEVVVRNILPSVERLIDSVRRSG